MNGINSKTGKALSGIAHLRQSIQNILTTPVGSRVMRRYYGSQLFTLLDSPINRATLVDIYAATAAAILQWEPRFIVQRVQVASAMPGNLVMDLTGIYLIEGRVITLERIEIS